MGEGGGGVPLSMGVSKYSNEAHYTPWVCLKPVGKGFILKQSGANFGHHLFFCTAGDKKDEWSSPYIKGVSGGGEGVERSVKRLRPLKFNLP